MMLTFPLQKPLSPTLTPTLPNGPETDPNGPEKDRNGPEMDRNQVLWGGDGRGVCRDGGGGGGCKGKRESLALILGEALSAPKSQRFLRSAIAMPIADPRNRCDFPRQKKAMPHCDIRVRWKVAGDLRFRAAISEPETLSFYRISGDLAPSTRKSLAIAIVRSWFANPKNLLRHFLLEISLARQK